MPRSPFDFPHAGPEALRAALRWGHDFAGWELSVLLQDLDRQREHIETVIVGENPRVAERWLYRMVDACQRRLVQVRDDGWFACWWEEEIVVAWIRARQGMRASPQKTVALLLKQARRFDKDATVADCWIEALNGSGLRALEQELLRLAEETGRGPVFERHRHAVDAIRVRRGRGRRSAGK
jgi:hypothetical protein